MLGTGSGDLGGLASLIKDRRDRGMVADERVCKRLPSRSRPRDAGVRSLGGDPAEFSSTQRWSVAHSRSGAPTATCARAVASARLARSAARRSSVTHTIATSSPARALRA
jgi:hypothetical protein